MRRRGGWRITVLLLCGCFGADLRKVHLPDLLEVDARTAKAAAPGEPLDRTKWPAAKAVRQMHSSFLNPDAMFDGDPATVAIVRDASSKDQYVLLDLGCMAKVRVIRQLHSVPEGFPQRYRIDVAGDHNFPYEAAFVGCGTPGESIATFRKAQSCRFIRITLLEPGPEAWNIGELAIH